MKPFGSRRLKSRIMIGVVVCAAVLLGLYPRLKARAALHDQTQTFAEVVVQVLNPKAAASVQQVRLPADVRAYQEASLHARTNGYISRWTEDIGAKVHADEVLAVIASPEIDAQWAQAKADEATVESRYAIAKVTADRWVELLKTNSVSREVTEQNVATMKSQQAALASARANVERLDRMRGFEHVTAPFDGVITARNVDVGTLIDSGAAGGSTMELFHVARIDKLRVYVDVPQDYAEDMHPGVAATLTLPRFPGQAFHGTVARTARALDPTSRTLRTEVDVDNQAETVMPGAYALIELDVSAAAPRLSLPVSTLLYRPDGVQVAMVDDHDRVVLRKVTLGRDFGTSVEITSGVDASDRVIANPGDAVTAGQAVRVAPDPS